MYVTSFSSLYLYPIYAMRITWRNYHLPLINLGPHRPSFLFSTKTNNLYSRFPQSDNHRDLRVSPQHLVSSSPSPIANWQRRSDQTWRICSLLTRWASSTFPTGLSRFQRRLFLILCLNRPNFRPFQSVDTLESGIGFKNWKNWREFIFPHFSHICTLKDDFFSSKKP